VDDSTIDEHQQDETGKDVYNSDLVTISMKMILLGGATEVEDYILLNAINDGIYTNFYMHDKIDTTRLMKVVFIFQGSGSGEEINMYRNLYAISTNNTESTGTIIYGDYAKNLPATTVGNYNKVTWEIDISNINAEDLLRFEYTQKNADGREAKMKACILSYYIKRD